MRGKDGEMIYHIVLGDIKVIAGCCLTEVLKAVLTSQLFEDAEHRATGTLWDPVIEDYMAGA